MRTLVNTNIINVECPSKMTERNCPLRKFIKYEQHTFHISVNETYLVPNRSYEIARNEFINTFDKIHAICAECKSKTK